LVKGNTGIGLTGNASSDGNCCGVSRSAEGADAQATEQSTRKLIEAFGQIHFVLQVVNRSKKTERATALFLRSDTAADTRPYFFIPVHFFLKFYVIAQAMLKL
jgi:hypothetical protein